MIAEDAWNRPLIPAHPRLAMKSEAVFKNIVDPCKHDIARFAHEFRR